jgi:hypothetical protein
VESEREEWKGKEDWENRMGGELRCHFSPVMVLVRG